MSKTQKIIGAVLAAVTITLASLSVFLPRESNGQALQQLPNTITQVTYTGGSAVLTNVQLATLTIPSVVSTITNSIVWIPTFLTVNNSNDFVYVSNPFHTFNTASNGIYTVGSISNNAVWVGIGLTSSNAPTGGIVFATNMTLRVKVESFQ